MNILKCGWKTFKGKGTKWKFIGKDIICYIDKRITKMEKILCEKTEKYPKGMNQDKGK